MSNAWSHLPNAHHIDWVLASFKENPKLWDEAVNAAYDESMAVAYGAALVARDKACDTAKNVKRSAIYDAALDAAIAAAESDDWEVALCCIETLITWDNCEDILNMSYEKLKVWAILSEDPRAIFLLDMVYVKEKLNGQCLVTSA